MRSLRHLAIFGVFCITAAASHAQISFGIGIGAPVYGPPVCPYGYYNSYPYACAPYGYYGPQWFPGGVFIGAGPWFREGYGREWGGDGDGWGDHRGWGDRGGYGYRGEGWDRGGREYARARIEGDGGFRGERGGFGREHGGFHGGDRGGFRGERH